LLSKTAPLCLLFVFVFFFLRRHRCPIVKSLNKINFVDEGKIKRIRGLVYTSIIAAANANRVVTTARGVFNNYIPDVYIYTDHFKKNKGTGRFVFSLLYLFHHSLVPISSLFPFAVLLAVPYHWWQSPRQAF
jgi:hypothetical protein